MKKIRVHELAKELGLSSKELLGRLVTLGIAAKSHSSSIDEADAAKVRGQKQVPAAPGASLAALRVGPPPLPTTTPPPAAATSPSRSLVEAPGAAEPVSAPPPQPIPAQAPVAAPVATVTVVKLDSSQITVKELAEKLGVKSSDIIKELMKKGMLTTINQPISAEAAQTVAKQIGIEVQLELPKEAGQSLQERFVEEELKETPESLKPRPPVVTVMGHVDHGKTKLLDAIRKTNVIALEAGSITQHIGAYQVEITGKKITFLDTPGHEAFTALRARGAKVTDIAVLVVAADDGVMPQTIEAIDHAQAAGVPIIVAINKMDKPNLNPDRVKQQLSEKGLVPEDWGGKTVMAPISAKAGTGIDHLLEMILLVAELQELKANPDKPAIGVVVESQLDRGRGPVATVLVKVGTLRVGDIVVAGTAYGKVRALLNDRGARIKEAPPATPAEVLGLSEVPQPGEILQVETDEKAARQRAERRKGELEKIATAQGATLEQFSQAIREGTQKELALVVKADVQGSIEAILQALTQKSTEKVTIKFIHAAAGAINLSDIMLAKASNAIVVGFGVGVDEAAKKVGSDEGVDIRIYSVIYKLVEDIEKAMEGILEPEMEWVVIGHAEVKQLYTFSKLGTIAGCYVTDGKLKRGGQIRIARGDQVTYEGKLESLRRFKDDAREVAAGFECGIAIPGMTDFQVGDRVEALEEQEKK